MRLPLELVKKCFSYQSDFMYFAQSNTMKPMFCLNRQFTRFCPLFKKINTDHSILYVIIPINKDKSYILERWYYYNTRIFFKVFLLKESVPIYISSVPLMEEGKWFLKREK